MNHPNPASGGPTRNQPAKQNSGSSRVVDARSVSKETATERRNKPAMVSAADLVPNDFAYQGRRAGAPVQLRPHPLLLESEATPDPTRIPWLGNRRVRLKFD